MNFKKSLTATVVALGLATGAGLSAAASANASSMWQTRQSTSSACWSSVNAKVVDLLRRGNKVEMTNCSGVSAAAGGGYMGIILYSRK
ncbi:hypothetical protein PV760_12375 [Paenarthrobacter sp. CC6]|uniref:hypothetical protein n=1 Tax=Paenarthrobacter sp. CC6 TaxID=3029184 RepID=UPI00339CDD19